METKLPYVVQPGSIKKILDKMAFTRIMTSLNMLRGPIAHCCPLADDEVVRLQLTVKDWFRLMGY